MSFQDAFNLTKGLTGSVMASREVDKLGPDAEATRGQGLQITNRATGEVSKGLIDPGADYETIRQQYEQAGYTAERSETPQYAARAGSRDVGVYATEAEAKSKSRTENFGLMRKRADVHEKYFDDDRAKQLRKDARQGEQDVMAQETHARAQESHAQTMKLGKLQVSAAEADEKKRSELEAGLGELSKAEYASDEDRAKATVDLYRRVLGPEKANALAAQYDARDIAAMQKRAMQMEDGFNTAVKTGGIDGAAQWYDSVNNDRVAKVIRDKGSVLVVDYDPRDPKGTYQVIGRGKDDNEALMAVQARVSKGGLMELANYELRALKTQADINASNASVAKDNAQAGLYRRTDPNAGKTGGANFPGLSKEDLSNAQRGAELFARKFAGATVPGRSPRPELTYDDEGKPALSPDLLIQSQHVAEGLMRQGIQPTPANVFSILSREATRQAKPADAQQRPAAVPRAPAESSPKSTDALARNIAAKVQQLRKSGDTAGAADLERQMKMVLQYSTGLR